LPSGYDGGLVSLGVDKSKITTVDHHYSHAFGAFCFSPFQDALIIVADALGNNTDTESYYLASRTNIIKFGGNDPDRNRAKGIGATYEAFTNFLGFTDQESGKVMALASFGSSDAFTYPLFEVSNRQVVASQLESTHQFGVLDFASRIKLPFGSPFPDPQSQVAQNIAAYIQTQTEQVLATLVADLIKITGNQFVCLSGGVAMNCVANSKIRSIPQLEDLFVFPPASDAGQAIGNALYGHFSLTGEMPKQNDSNYYLGKTYTENAIRSALSRQVRSTPFGRVLKHRYDYTKVNEPHRIAAELIADGNVIGWFQDGSEAGPRALGHRSILADPRTLTSKERINKKIKRREWFRPFAPSMIFDAFSSYFDADSVSKFMLEAPRVFPSKQQNLCAASHVDGTARVQLVTEELSPKFFKLIQSFNNITGVPAVLNTSFNCQEPIVETPGDALFTFLTTDLDYLIIHDYLVSKKT